MTRCTIVVPCYNERARLNLDAFRRFADDHDGIDFLFVDDGSSDGTGDCLDAAAVARPDRFLTLRLERNMGKAEAVRRGILLADSLGANYVGFWDADLATPLSAILSFLDHLERNPGVRMAFGARVRMLGRRVERSKGRHYLGRVFATTVSALFGLPAYDTQCGAKIFRSSPEVRRIFEQPFRSRWIFDVEILTRALADRPETADDRIHEIPLAHWSDVDGSKVQAIDFVRAVIELWAIRRAWRVGVVKSLPVRRRERPHLRPVPAPRFSIKGEVT